MAQCPFSHSAQNSAALPPADTWQRGDGVLAGRRKVVHLYEEYVHLHWLKEIWESPVTEKPVLEPCFAAAFHGIELCWLLLAQFVLDDRKYVAKRPRIDLVVADIQEQCILLTEIVDGELEEGSQQQSRATLTQSFPFEAGPPTTRQASHSHGLARLVAAVEGCIQGMGMPERNSVAKMVLNLTNTFDSSFGRWTVGLGIEHQLNELRLAAGLAEEPRFRSRARNLDYDSLVRPQVVESTLTAEHYDHREDFFFRTVHLGTECWSFIAHCRLVTARQLAEQQQWHVAAGRTMQAARIFHYLGDHVLLLTSMNLRDYLHLKVEIEGTSGEGSQLVKNFRPKTRALFLPFAAALTGSSSQPSPSQQPAAAPEPSADDAQASRSPRDPADAAPGSCDTAPSRSQEVVSAAVLEVYEQPDRDEQHAGLYNFAKSLECIESALMGGFYYKHYLLARNVLGSDAKGTMNRAVAALDKTFQASVFPELDKARSALGLKIDAALVHRKGRIMANIQARGSRSSSPAGRAPAS